MIRRLRGAVDYLRRSDGLAFRVPLSRAVHVRVQPPAAASAALRVDLEVIGGWLTASRPSGVGFAQIGAYDGVTNDPIHDLVRRFGWRGILVEPQPEPFERLCAAYEDVEGLVLLNAAVAAEPGTATLWRVRDPQRDDPWWVSQAASFDRNHLIRHLRGHDALLDRVVGQSVEAVTLADVFARAPRPVDVLQIDAEGYDAAIVRMLSAVPSLPTVVRFEHRHLPASDFAEITENLRSQGYRFSINEADTLAVRLP